MIPIFKPFMPEEATSGIEEIIHSGQLAYGRNGKDFEIGLSKFIGNEKVLSINSYNNALLVALSVLGLKPGDEVIASPVSCVAANQPLVVKGLKIVWADVNPLTGTLSVDDVRSKITSKTKAIIHNHYCGYLGEIDAINALGKEFGIPVIDDCVEAFGSELNGKKAGGLGTDITVFSFQTVRLPNTIDGGALAFDKQDMFEKAKLIRDYGIDRVNFRDSLNEIDAKCDISMEGYGALMGELNSYIGIKQLGHLDSLIYKQRANADVWNQRIRCEEGIEPLQVVNNSVPNHWVYGALAKDKIQTIKEMREKGFYATGVHINNNIYSVFGNRSELRGVNEFMKCFVAFPCGWWFKLTELDSY